MMFSTAFILYAEEWQSLYDLYILTKKKIEVEQTSMNNSHHSLTIVKDSCIGIVTILLLLLSGTKLTKHLSSQGVLFHNTITLK